MTRIGLIGAGNIGEEVIRQAREKGFGIGPIVTTSGVYDGSKVQRWKGKLSDYLKENPEYRLAVPDDYQAPLRETDAVLLTISTRDDGEEAYTYMRGLLPEKPVITCEKGALSSASRFKELLPEMKKGRLGYRATVGGGTSLLKVMQDSVRRGFDGRVYAVINGTLNFIFDRLSRGRSLGETVYRARILGFAEPGAKDPLDVINTEACKDVPRKSAIFYNTFLDSLGNENPSFLDVSTIMSTLTPLTPDMFARLVREARNRRYIVSITPHDSAVDDDVIAGYRLNMDGWVIQGGFRRITDNPLYERFLPEDVDNALFVTKGKVESKGEYSHSGPGAGAPPTVDSMMTDMDDMRKAGIVR